MELQRETMPEDLHEVLKDASKNTITCIAMNPVRKNTCMFCFVFLNHKQNKCYQLKKRFLRINLNKK